MFIAYSSKTLRRGLEERDSTLRELLQLRFRSSKPLCSSVLGYRHSTPHGVARSNWTTCWLLDPSSFRTGAKRLGHVCLLEVGAVASLLF